MKIFVINGSPQGTRSNTYRLTKAFLSGILEKQEDTEIQECHLREQDIRACLGCFGCWKKTPGKCCIPDDMAEILPQLVGADVVIWSFPLYYFGVPGPLKNLIDRQLPLVSPFMDRRAHHGGHFARYDRSRQQNVLISTCGFYTAQGNYDSVLQMFDHFLGKDGYETIFCGQGELFRVPELAPRTGPYLDTVRQAGREFAAGAVSRETRDKLQELLLPREVFEQMADQSWDVPENG